MKKSFTRKNKSKIHTRSIKKAKSRTRKQKSPYSSTDFNSGDGMLTTVWGPGMWHFLHTTSFNYPVTPTAQEKKHYRDFVVNLQYVLPCKYCRMNLKSNFKTYPLTLTHMKDRHSFSLYIYNLHEIVNKMLNKKSNLTFEEVRERYEHFRARCTDAQPKLFKFLKNKTRRDKGCTEPLYGKKSKCILKIVPQEEKGETFQMDKQCIKTRE